MSYKRVNWRRNLGRKQFNKWSKRRDWWNKGSRKKFLYGGLAVGAMAAASPVSVPVAGAGYGLWKGRKYVKKGFGAVGRYSQKGRPARKRRRKMMSKYGINAALRRRQRVKKYGIIGGKKRRRKRRSRRRAISRTGMKYAFKRKRWFRNKSKVDWTKGDTKKRNYSWQSKMAANKRKQAGR